MKQVMTVTIEIESNCTHTTRNIEEALNFFWGSDGTFTITEVTQPSDQALRAHVGDPCIYCGVAHDNVAVGDCPGR